TWCAIRAKWCRAQCCSSTYGICTSTRRPTSSMCTSGACAARSTITKPIRSSIRCAAWDFASVLLAKTLRSSTLRLALLAIAIFGAAVIGLFSYVYWSAESFVRSRADRAIAAEQATLLRAYQAAGRSGLIAAIEQRVAEPRLAGGQYL